jgi:hypothetical protein
MGYKGDAWRKGGGAMQQTVKQAADVGGSRGCLGRMLNDKTTEGYGINSLRGDFDNLGARAVNRDRIAKWAWYHGPKGFREQIRGLHYLLTDYFYPDDGSDTFL